MSYWGFSESAWRDAMAAAGQPGASPYNPPAPYDGLPQGSQLLIGQELADEITLIAQKYTGHLYGHPTRAGQYNTVEAGKVFIDYETAWEEPLVFPDDCEFCQRTLSDERIELRVAGFQAAIDKEVRAQRGSESFPLTDLPLYLKRRMCIEWNHAFKRYLDTKPYLYYDFEKREIKESVKVDERNAVAAHPEQEAPRDSVYFADS